MQPWIEAGGIILLAGVGIWAGAWSSRLEGNYWTVGYWLPLILILLVGLSYWITLLQFTPPISWLVAGRTEIAVMALVVTMILTTPLSRLTAKRDRMVVAGLMVLIVVKVSAWPFLAPAFNRNYLTMLRTRFDADEVCLQNTDYTCGPAAAVTALRQLNIHADEGELALLAHTTSASGTPPDVLAETLQTHFSSKGLRSEYRYFRNILELKEYPAAIALVKFGFLLDHYVAVLKVDDTHVVIGDPLLGKEKMTHEEFGRKWRYSGVSLARSPG